MAELDHVFLVQTGKAVSREELPSAIQEALKVAPEEATLQFTIRPLVLGEEFSRVVDRMARAEESNKCNGTCD